MQINDIGSFAHQAPPSISTSKKLEAAFLEEMLKYVFPDTGSREFSGGVGEQQFKSFLLREYAGALSEKIDLGLRVKDSFHA